MIKKLFFVVVLLGSSVAQAGLYNDYTLNIVSGSKYDSSNFSENEKPIAKELRAIQRTAIGQASIGAFIQSDGLYYAITYGGNRIDAFNLATKQYLGGWELIRNTHAVMEKDLQWMVSGKKYEARPVLDGLGCLQAHPLRYGDSDGDGIPEIFLLLGDYNIFDLVIFSTQSHYIIFSAILTADDILPEVFSDPEELKLLFKSWDKIQDKPQYLALAATAGKNPSLEVGKKSFAKIYFADFDTDGAFDILVWRKLYESRLQADPVKGFIKNSDTFVHYKLVNGEYKKQETDQTTIKGWLTAKQLTWQKGYPSKSECPGQEGQLIPEMHDPLLNDPDVLQ